MQPGLFKFYARINRFILNNVVLFEDKKSFIKHKLHYDLLEN
jgi:hypothetical protein